MMQLKLPRMGALDVPSEWADELVDTLEAWAVAQSQPAAEPVDVQPAREVPDESVPSFHPRNGPLVTGEYLGQFLRAHGMAIVYREGPRNAE